MDGVVVKQSLAEADNSGGVPGATAAPAGGKRAGDAAVEGLLCLRRAALGCCVRPVPPMCTAGLYQYFLKVVPTSYSDLRNNTIYTNQFRWACGTRAGDTHWCGAGGAGLVTVCGN